VHFARRWPPGRETGPRYGNPKKNPGPRCEEKEKKQKMAKPRHTSYVRIYKGLVADGHPRTAVKHPGPRTHLRKIAYGQVTKDQASEKKPGGEKEMEPGQGKGFVRHGRWAHRNRMAINWRLARDSH